MAQEHYGNALVAERLEKESLIAQGLVLWMDRAENYRTLILRYLFLAEEKRRFKMAVHRITNWVLDDYPKIPLFRFWQIDDARAYLEDMNLRDLKKEIYQIEQATGTNYAYNTLSSWVAEAEYLIAHKDRKKDKHSLLMGADRVRDKSSAVSLTRRYHYTESYY
ncbi:hypothetical protein IJH33_02435 [Candidatus Saccharibacteria bacterium]|nr:hypothetical protein [Candidatus Saccharibacteria bacterium]